MIHQSVYNTFITRQPVYDPYKGVVIKFRVSTCLVNRVGFGFGLAGPLSLPKPDMVTCFANPNIRTLLDTTCFKAVMTINL
jgi:hypothetical protein